MVAYLLIIKINWNDIWMEPSAVSSGFYCLSVERLLPQIYMQSIQKQDGQVRSLLSTDTYQRNNF